MTQVRFRVDLSPGCAIGPGKVVLLEAIAAAGSLSAAARQLGMSYRRAWLLLDNLNQSFREPLTEAVVGGRGGGGVALTALGYKVIAVFRKLEREIEQMAAVQCRQLLGSVDTTHRRTDVAPVKRVAGSLTAPRSRGRRTAKKKA